MVPAASDKHIDALNSICEKILVELVERVSIDAEGWMLLMWLVYKPFKFVCDCCCYLPLTCVNLVF